MARQNYIHGNAARKMNQELSPKKTHLRVVKKANLELADQKAVKKGKYSLAHVIALLFCVAIVGTFIAGYIKLNSDVMYYQKQCASLQKEYEDLKTSNDLYEDRINNSVDLAEIERVAVCELGMKLAGEGQIVVYSGEIEDYVKQYADLPQ